MHNLYKFSRSESVGSREKPRSRQSWLPSPPITRWQLFWILATALGGIGGSIALRAEIALTQKGLLSDRSPWMLNYGAFGLTMGLAISLPQSWLLARALTPAGKGIRVGIQWVFATATGCVVGAVASPRVFLWLSLFVMAIFNVDYAWASRLFGVTLLWISAALVSAFVVTVLQRLVLRRQFDPVRYWIWKMAIWKRVVGWCASFAVGLAVVYVAPGSDVIRSVAGGMVGGGVLGAITGIELARLLGVDSTRTSRQTEGQSEP